MQHKVSGLRARFHPGQDDWLGIIYAKPYKIESIDPEYPGKLANWQMFVGLGVGARIYRAGAELLPGQRWALSGVTTEAAQGVRRRLHAEDPYRWQTSSCPWCRARRIDWGTVAASAFAGHPALT